MKLREKLQAIFSAASFAEVGEWDTAREILNQSQAKRPAKKAKKRTTQRPQSRARVYKA